MSCWFSFLFPLAHYQLRPPPPGTLVLHMTKPIQTPIHNYLLKQVPSNIKSRLVYPTLKIIQQRMSLLKNMGGERTEQEEKRKRTEREGIEPEESSQVQIPYDGLH